MQEYNLTFEEYVNKAKKYSREEYYKRYGETEERLGQMEEDTLKPNIPVGVVASLADFCPVWMKIHLLSFCMKISGNPDYALQIFDIIDTSTLDEVGEYNRLNLFSQLKYTVFCDPRLQTSEVNLCLAKLYRSLFGMLCNVFGIRARIEIPREIRNKNLVFVFTGQMLRLNHGPTKTLLDRCYVLQKYCGKKIYIINTAMVSSTKGEAPFYKMVRGNYNRQLSDYNELEWNGEVFDFMQCPNDMPDPDTIADIVKLICDKKPYYILDIGGGDVCADLCGMFVPEITLSTVPSDIVESCAMYQIVGEGVAEKIDRQITKVLGIELSNVREAVFTSSFKPQVNHYSRAQIGIWEERFIILIVGGRLDAEIDDDFLEVLDNVTKKCKEIGVIFMGKYITYKERVNNYLYLKNSSKYIGFQSDALAVNECCDLYVNPLRTGGGTSAAEALYKGLPVVTLPQGDVALGAGKEFHVSDYQEMEGIIIRYANDRSFYRKMSKKARERAAILTDSSASFGTAIREIEQKL